MSLVWNAIGATGLLGGLTYIIYHRFLKAGNNVCRSMTDMSSKTVIITGCDKGIGYHTALDIARRNARVIMACRNMETANAAAEQIKQETGNNNVLVRKLDVSSLACVRKFAEDIHSEESRVNVLINNAGIAAGKSNERTEEGLELVMTTNYLGHFLLTLLLLDTLKKSAPSRIVNVSSNAHYWTDLDPTDFNSDKTYVRRKLYSRSKLAQILFTRELSKRLQGTGVTVNALHPGVIHTNFFSRVPQPFGSIINGFGSIFFKKPEQGAQTSIYLAVSEEVEGMSGNYYSDCRVKTPSSQARNDENARILFEASEKICGLEQKA